MESARKEEVVGGEVAATKGHLDVPSTSSSMR